MPLPITRRDFLKKGSHVAAAPILPIFHINEKRELREDVAVKSKDSGYRPDDEYHPTYKAVRCSICKTVGAAEFVNGFDLKAGDRLMEGKPIVGLCLRCRKETELVPVPATKEFLMFYGLQRSLDAMAKRGQPIGSGTIWPEARLEKYRKWKNGTA